MKFLYLCNLMVCDISNLNYLIEENSKFESMTIGCKDMGNIIKNKLNFQSLHKCKQYTVDKGQFEFEPDRLLVRALVWRWACAGLTSTYVGPVFTLCGQIFCPAHHRLIWSTFLHKTRWVNFTSGGRRSGTIKPQTDLDHATVGGAVLASCP